MIPRVLEIQNPGNYLNVERGHLVISREKNEVGRVPISDIGILIISNPACSVSVNVLSTLLGQGSQVVLCGQNFTPAGIFLPVGTKLAHATRLQQQIEASEPLKKRLWSYLVEQKVINQAHALEVFGGDSSSIKSLISKIKSGDSTNIEAQAARAYWQRIMGSDFRRNQLGDGLNALLNYGYTVLRAAVLRSIVSTGLNPTLSLHHSAIENPTALADDLMEPLRPLVDVMVKRLSEINLDYVCPDSKNELCSILTVDLYLNGLCTTLTPVLNQFCHSLIDSLEIKQVKLSNLDLQETFNKLISWANNEEDA